MSELMDGLVDEVILPSNRGSGRRAPPLTMEIVRELGVEDMPALLVPPPVGQGLPSLKHVRHIHHELARLLCEGKEAVEVALLTGYSPSYISNIQNDPAFAELVSYYSTQRELVFVDVLERMRVLGLSSLDELARRLEEKPGDFSERELMELTELLLVKGAKPGSVNGSSGGGGGSPGGVNINVQFVQASPVELPPLIEQKPQRRMLD